MRYLIIGNSVAAVGAVEAIREVDKDGMITIVSDEIYHTYSRPLIPRLVKGKTKTENMYFRDPDFYDKNDVKALLGRKAVSIDFKAGKVRLEDGKELEYDKLLIATGGIPFVPPIDGLGDDVLKFTTWDDTNRMMEESKGATHAVVIGAGLIGLKAAESLKSLGKQVTVIELAGRILSAITDEKAASILESGFADKDIRIIKSNSVSNILRDKGMINGVVLQDKERIDCDMVVAAIGVRPNTDLVKDTGIRVERGILVDSHMLSSIPGVYAAGDVAQAYDLLNNDDRVLPIWPTAYIQGRTAGHNMAGRVEEYEGGYVMNSIEFNDIPIISFGLISEKAGNEVLIDYRPEEKVYKKIVLDGEHVIGGIFITEIESAGVVNGLVRERASIRDFKDELLNPHFGLVYMPHKLRLEKLMMEARK